MYLPTYPAHSLRTTLGHWSLAQVEYLAEVLGGSGAQVEQELAEFQVVNM